MGALRESGFEDPEAELKRWADEAAFQEREQQRETQPEPPPHQAEERALRRTVWDKPERQRRADIACDEYNGAYMHPQEQALWDKWARACADIRIEEIMSPCLEDVGLVCRQLGDDIDELHRQLQELRVLVETLQKHMTPDTPRMP